MSTTINLMLRDLPDDAVASVLDDLQDWIEDRLGQRAEVFAGAETTNLVYEGNFDRQAARTSGVTVDVTQPGGISAGSHSAVGATIAEGRLEASGTAEV